MIRTEKAARGSWLDRLALEQISQESLLGIILMLLVLGLTLARPDFLSGSNLTAILMDSSYVAVAAVGMTLVIISGGIDISVGSILAFCGVTGGMLINAGVPAPLAFLGMILTGGLFGFINGALVAWAGIPSIIVTLGMMSVVRGLLVQLTGGSWIRNLPPDFYIGQKSLLGVPVPVLVMIVVVVAAALWLRYSPLGRQFYAVGASHEAAHLAGIPVKRIQLLAFTLNGLLVGVASFIFATRFTAIQTNAGIGFELQVITAAVVGGVSILGGSGTVLGAVLGVFLLNVIGTGLIFMRVSAYWFQTVQGGLILLAVMFDIIRKRRLGEL